MTKRKTNTISPVFCHIKKTKKIKIKKDKEKDKHHISLLLSHQKQRQWKLKRQRRWQRQRQRQWKDKDHISLLLSHQQQRQRKLKRQRQWQWKRQRYKMCNFIQSRPADFTSKIPEMNHNVQLKTSLQLELELSNFVNQSKLYSSINFLQKFHPSPYCIIIICKQLWVYTKETFKISFAKSHLTF